MRKVKVKINGEIFDAEMPDSAFESWKDFIVE